MRRGEEGLEDFGEAGPGFGGGARGAEGLVVALAEPDEGLAQSILVDIEHGQELDQAVDHRMGQEGAGGVEPLAWATMRPGALRGGS